MPKELLTQILEGDTKNIPPLCLIKDYEHLRCGDEVEVCWKLVTGLRNENVERLTSEEAEKIKKILGMEPAHTLRGFGTIFETPERSFLKKFTGQKNNVYITV